MAVKVIRAQLAEDAGFRARFAREVAAARKVGGLFTAQVVDADLDGPVPWLVTAYVPGISLAEAVDRQGPLPAETVLALAAALAEGLNAIHAAGVIHRDLKPSNVLLAPDGPRIIDFGISSAAEATSLTGTGLMIGSPGFMSPEQAEGLTVEPSSDIFSLAGVLTFAARGEGPFGTGDTAALLYRVVHGTPNLDQIPAKIRPLISRCLSRDSKDRPSAAEFLAALTATYPSAADLTDWLPTGLLAASARRASPAGADPHPPTAAGGAAADGAAAGGAAATAGLAMAAAAGTSEPATAADPTASNNAMAIGSEPTRTSVAHPPPPTQATPHGPQGYPAPMGHQPAGPGLAGPQGNQWSGPVPPTSPRRRRPWWLWAAGAVAACGAVIAVLVVWLGSGHSTASAGASPHPTGPAPAPTVGNLQLARLQVGDCLTGANMELNTSNPWPKLTLAVPCGQPHTAEVFFADNNFWPKNSPFPGSSAITKDGNTACDKAFQSYVGISYTKSMYTWTNIIPDTSTWPTGDRGLHCVAYYSTPKQPAGASITGSIRDARK